MEIFKDMKHSIKERVEDLLAQMTMPQKVAQLQCMMLVRNSVEGLEAFPEGIGEVTAFSGGETVEANADFCKTVQDTVMEKNDLGIPAILHAEALTGINAAGATIFPAAIGLGATWNPETVERMTEIIRGQMLAVGIRQALSPVMDVSRDPRWGRIGETYGEDPTLCAAMSVAFTKGLQGETLKDGVIATAKHFLGYAFGDGGLNMASNPIPERELREVYAKPFQAAITEGGLASVMNSYGTIDNDMVIKSKRILTDLLRGEMGFDGLLVSDYMSINRAVDLKLCEDPKTGGVEALKAGLDVECPTPYGYTQALIEAAAEGVIDEGLIDRSVRRILTAKFMLGLFEAPYAREESIPEAYDGQSSLSHSLKAARESIVLLKNDGILPLKRDKKKIAVIGPHGGSLRLLFGCYTYPASIEMMLGGGMGDMAGMMSGEEGDTDIDMVQLDGDAPPFLEGCKIRSEAPIVTQIINQLYGDTTPSIVDAVKAKCPAAQVVYEKGCEVAGTSRRGFDAAIAAAKDADIVILTLGGKYGWGSNCTIGEGIDCDDIGLPGIQEEFARLIYETGTPAVFVHMDARPLSSEYIAAHFPAVIEYWFPGVTGGRALADVLFGDYNPAGRLPVTAARNAGQIPIFATNKNGNGYSGGKGVIMNKYAEGTKLPLFYFGEGKSYTEFTYSNLKLDKRVKSDGAVHVCCDIINSGDRDGEEVVQLYVSDELASMLRPNKELAGFVRIPLKAGETRTVHFIFRADQFAFLDADMKWVVEAGMMTVRVGGSSEDIRLTGTFEIENTAYITGKDRGFFAQAEVL